jgi:formylglycine-generating enzyme required for sulfatase activity
MADVFISYRALRGPAISHFAEVIQNYGYSVWWDYGLLSGEEFEPVIEGELRAANAVIVVWCSYSVESKWVKKEAKLAKTRNTLMHVLIEDVELPWAFTDDHRWNLSDWNGDPRSADLDRLFDELEKRVKKEVNVNRKALAKQSQLWHNHRGTRLADMPLDEKKAARYEERRLQQEAKNSNPLPASDEMAMDGGVAKTQHSVVEQNSPDAAAELERLQAAKVEAEQLRRQVAAAEQQAAAERRKAEAAEAARQALEAKLLADKQEAEHQERLAAKRLSEEKAKADQKAAELAASFKPQGTPGTNTRHWKPFVLPGLLLAAFLAYAGYQVLVEQEQKAQQAEDTAKAEQARLAQKAATPALWQLTINATPSTATIRLPNITDPYKAGMALAAGDYQIEVSAAGYRSATRTVQLKGANQTIEVVLEKEPPPAPVATAPPTLTPGTVYRTCRDCPEMVVVPAGRFLMGSPESETGRQNDEGPQHDVVLAKPFAVGKYEITRGQFRAFVDVTHYETEAEKDAANGCWLWAKRADGKTNWGWTANKNWRNADFYGLEQANDKHPVLCVSWNDAQAYVAWLNNQPKEENANTGTYRLPSETEWEYMARGSSSATNTVYSFGNASTALCQHGNVADQTKRPDGGVWREGRAECADGYAYTAPVGSFSKNGFGLYDVHGNVWEWVQDCHHDSYKKGEAPTDSHAWQESNCEKRVFRGGSWLGTPDHLRSAFRSRNAPGFRNCYIGFRLAQNL